MQYKYSVYAVVPTRDGHGIAARGPGRAGPGQGEKVGPRTRPGRAEKIEVKRADIYLVSQL